MKIGVSSYSFSKYIQQERCTYRDVCDIARKIGYDGIEFVGLRRYGLGNDEEATADDLRKYCRSIGLEIIAYTVGANFLAEDIDAEMARLRANVDMTARLGAPLMRHDVAHGPRAGVLGYAWRDAVEEIAPRIREIADYAAARGIRTCTENHGRFFQDAERMEALIRAVGHPGYGWLVDMGNFMGVDADIPASVLTAAPYAFHVHAKDNLRKPGNAVAPEGWRRTRGGDFFRATVLGHGDVPVQQCVNILREAGYDGYVSLEFEGWEDNLRALESAHDYLRRIVT